MRLRMLFVGGVLTMVLAACGLMAAEEGPPVGPPPPPPPENALVEGMGQVNALDVVTLALAQAHAGKKEFEKAIAVLEELIKSGQDKTATGFAHLALARIYKQKGDADKAAAELKLVSGPASVGALAMMLESAGIKGPDQAAKLEKILKSAEDPVMKALVLRRLSLLYTQAGNVEKLVKLKEQSAGMLSYKEAQAALDVEQKAGRQGAFRPPMMPGGGLGGPGGFGPPLGGGENPNPAKPLPAPDKDVF